MNSLNVLCFIGVLSSALAIPAKGMATRGDFEGIEELKSEIPPIEVDTEFDGGLMIESLSSSQLFIWMNRSHVISLPLNQTRRLTVGSSELINGSINNGEQYFFTQPKRADWSVDDVAFNFSATTFVEIGFYKDDQNQLKNLHFRVVMNLSGNITYPNDKDIDSDFNKRGLSSIEKRVIDFPSDFKSIGMAFGEGTTKCDSKGRCTSTSDATDATSYYSIEGKTAESAVKYNTEVFSDTVVLDPKRKKTHILSQAIVNINVTITEPDTTN